MLKKSPQKPLLFKDKMYMMMVESNIFVLFGYLYQTKESGESCGVKIFQKMTCTFLIIKW